MGAEAHLRVLGPKADELLACAEHRLADLEAWWSRFVPSSDLSRVNAGAGQAVEVQPETIEVVELAVVAWALTGGRFDPSVLPALVAAGYDRTFTAIAAGRPGAGRWPEAARHPPPGVPRWRCDVDAGTIRVPAGVQLDLGGIGKGHAADIVARELLASGATGACVNLGGDVRVTGSPPDGAAWTIAVQHPLEGASIVTLALADGAVATSTTAYRRWGDDAHHLIDPATGLPARTDLLAVTVVAGEAAWAEVVAKAALLAGLDGAPSGHRRPRPHRPARRRRRERVDPAWLGGSRRMNPQLWWFVTRSTGIVTWVLATATVLWGLGVTSKPFGKKPAPNWTLDLHRFLGALTVLFLAGHLGALVADSYTNWTIADLAVPYATTWKPGPVAWGIVAALAAAGGRGQLPGPTAPAQGVVAAAPPHELPRLRGIDRALPVGGDGPPQRRPQGRGRGCGWGGRLPHRLPGPPGPAEGRPEAGAKRPAVAAVADVPSPA